MAEEFSWRPATADDCSLLAEMNWCLIQDEGHSNPMTPPDLEERMRHWITSGEYRAILFVLRGQPAAYVLFRQNTDGVYIRHFYVERRLRRRGAGRLAMETLKREVFPSPCRIVLEVLWGNESGHRFWTAVGFRNCFITMELWN